ncbi:splicing factor U2AF 35 kDa subunit [Blastocystis sp. ATCC 50177/Nand II]|uniref:Splicing factor U2AF 35 kDa subunit n=1 Tax=Blastocystis sp. subtype 1 (strain ATCC 50177 / NandII) TaxID=478820 RepID=A0A196SGT6_BLAHN|nr:splicing factor U2AF 35 kDa subunit [Blastocystis sp. ATCC 50177/Nand II]
MADHLVRVYGTEDDRVNCPFYFKIGACRHGDRCTRKHNRPSFSQTILIKQMYHNPKANPMPGDPEHNRQVIQNEFDKFYEEVFDELSSSYGPIEELHVCDNVCEHMLGNVYVKFEDEEDAEKALKGLSGRYFAGRPLAVEYSPVTDFREARCRQHEEGQCTRGGYCNFMHLMTPSQAVFYRCFPKGRCAATLPIHS